MASVVRAAALVGVEAVPVQVEVDLLRRLPSVSIIGLVSASVRESAERVRSALLASGQDFPRSRVVVSLAPADLRKDGTHYDLAIAVGILAAAERLPEAAVADVLFWGELSLQGELRGTRGTLAAACLAKALGVRAMVVPACVAAEAALVEGLNVVAAQTLADTVRYLEGGVSPRAVPEPSTRADHGVDLRDVRGQESARAALEVAAAGGHNLLLEGPPGCGKTMLAARLPTILPPLGADEVLEVTRIHSVAGLVADGRVVSRRPFRAPHHSVSAAGLVGGAQLRPGEVSLAHHGVLFLDEFPEFPRTSREVLRGPLEDRRVMIARAGGSVCLPASFTLVAAANPCPCGNWGERRRACQCTPAARDHYRSRLSGPIVDRIDLRVRLGRVEPSTLLGATPGEDSATVGARVLGARGRQARRYGGRWACNAEIPAEQIVDAAQASSAALRALQVVLERSGASARVGRRLLKVARTLADLEGVDALEVRHVSSAVSLREEAV